MDKFSKEKRQEMLKEFRSERTSILQYVAVGMFGFAIGWAACLYYVISSLN